jgi:integrase
MDARIDELEPLTIEKWRIERMKEVKASSINRDMTALKAALNWGVNLGVIETNPLARVRRLQERDSQQKVRFLSPDENARLMAALKRCSDYLRAMVIISLNTGVRRGALFALLWEDVDMERRILTLRGEEAKNSKINHVPINGPAFQAFKSLPRTSSLVFPSPKTGNQIDNCRHSWKTLLKAAQIENFRWHDMRHDFASQLVMKGVDLNTVRELLGHSDMKMTLRYAHLAPEAKVKAVGVLG